MDASVLAAVDLSEDVFVQVAAILAGRAPDRIIAAGGGKLLNVVIRDA